MAEVVMTEYGRTDFSSEARVHALDVFVLLKSRPGLDCQPIRYRF